MKLPKFQSDAHKKSYLGARKEIKEYQKNPPPLHEILYKQQMREQGHEFPHMHSEIQKMRNHPNPELYEPYATRRKQFLIEFYERQKISQTYR